jgi:hypothetical protein
MNYDWIRIHPPFRVICVPLNSDLFDFWMNYDWIRIHPPFRVIRVPLNLPE